MTEEITDEQVKKKHKEFDQRIQSLLNELRGRPKGNILQGIMNAVKRLPKTRLPKV